MRILAPNATYYLFVVISQLVALTQGAFFRVGKSSKAATEASEGASGSVLSGERAVGFAGQHPYWYPPSNNQINERLANQQLRIFAPSPTSSSSSKLQSVTSRLKKFVLRPKEKKLPLESSALRNDDQRRQAFAEELQNLNVPFDHHINLIQLCFKHILKETVLNEEEALKWLDVLKKNLHQQANENFVAFKAISILYGLYSLRLRYLNDHHLQSLIATMNSPDNTEFLRNIDEMIWQLKTTYFRVPGEGRNKLDIHADWGNVILNPSRGLSYELADKDSFISIIKDEKELSSAMHDNRRDNMEALTKLQQNFNSYSAHKRVAILAALYHQMAGSAKGWEQPIGVLKNLANSAALFRHESELLKWISKRRIPRRGNQAS